MKFIIKMTCKKTSKIKQALTKIIFPKVTNGSKLFVFSQIYEYIIAKSMNLNDKKQN